MNAMELPSSKSVAEKEPRTEAQKPRNLEAQDNIRVATAWNAWVALARSVSNVSMGVTMGTGMSRYLPRLRDATAF